MKENLLITFFLCIFAKWIGGSHEPSTRVIQQPFHFAYLLESLNVGVYTFEVETSHIVFVILLLPTPFIAVTIISSHGQYIPSLPPSLPPSSIG